jgi:hypothetical protein
MVMFMKKLLEREFVKHTNLLCVLKTISNYLFDVVCLDTIFEFKKIAWVICFLCSMWHPPMMLDLCNYWLSFYPQSMKMHNKDVVAGID